MEIKNLSVIVSGGASGMGAATAELLSQLGAKVAIFDLNSEAAQKKAAEINGTFQICDITDSNSVERALQATIQSQGIPRVCVNCAGIVLSKRMVGKEGPLPLEDFKRIIEVNLIGTFNLMRLVSTVMTQLTPLEDTQERGVIINTASIAAFEGQIGQTAYSASKGGVVSLTLPAARELSQFGIRVNTIAPGLIDTPMFEKIPPEAKTALANSVPFPKRLGYPEEFAKLVAHIIDNVLINGEVIRLDGALRMPPK